MSRREGFRSLLLLAAGLLVPLSVLEVLALAPTEQWLWPRVWWTQAGGVGPILLAVVAAALAASGVAGALGWRPRGSDVVALLVLLVLASTHLRSLLQLWIETGEALQLLALGVVVAVSFAGLKLLAVRRQLSVRELWSFLIALLGIGTKYQRLVLYRDHYKFVLERATDGSDQREFLYDLALSPDEDVDVRSQEAALAARLHDELETILRNAVANRPDTPAVFDPEVMELLKELGYVR